MDKSCRKFECLSWLSAWLSLLLGTTGGAISGGIFVDGGDGGGGGAGPSLNEFPRIL
jgi:hypothetical protein